MIFRYPLRFAVHHVELNKDGLQVPVNSHLRFADVYVNKEIFIRLSISAATN